MTVVLLKVDDLTPFGMGDDDRSTAMVADAIAMAAALAPCFADPDTLTDGQVAAAKAILRAAVLRWNDAGSGALSGQTMGELSVTLDTRHPRRTMFWPSEIATLQKICKGGSDGGAFSVDTAAGPMLSHPVFFGNDGSGTFGAIAFDNDSYDGFDGYGYY